jgi:hypothetical protein
LKLRYDVPLSNFVFSFNLRRYNLVVGGEGALWFYRYHSRGAGALPHFEQPVPVGEEGGALYAGSHPVGRCRLTPA